MKLKPVHIEISFAYNYKNNMPTIITMSKKVTCDVIVRHSLYGLSMRMLVCVPVTCSDKSKLFSTNPYDFVF